MFNPIGLAIRLGIFFLSVFLTHQLGSIYGWISDGWVYTDNYSWVVPSGVAVILAVDAVAAEMHSLAQALRDNHLADNDSLQE